MKEERSLWQTLAFSASAAMVAEAITLPFDTAKVRLQLQNIANEHSHMHMHRYRGSINTIRTIVREEGGAAPFKGLVPGVHRQILFTGLRLGLYERVRDTLAGDSAETPLYARLGAALATSAIGITVANPSDVVKIRQQACTIGAQAGKEGNTSKYSSATEAYRRILAEEGLRDGLYRGYLPNLIRNSIISATELVSYDSTKQALLAFGMPDNIGVHFSAGLAAGFAATCLGSPFDVIGTRLMAESDAGSRSLGSFIVKMVREEGITSMYKGFTNNFARIGSFNIVLWLTYEQLQRSFASHTGNR